MLAINNNDWTPKWRRRLIGGFFFAVLVGYSMRLAIPLERLSSESKEIRSDIPMTRQEIEPEVSEISWGLDDIFAGPRAQFHVRLAGFLSSCSSDETAGLMAAIVEDGTWDTEIVWSATMLAWTHSDADGAIDFSRKVAEAEDHRREFDRLSLTLGAWASHDPGEARVAAENEEGVRALVEVIKVMLESDIGLAVDTYQSNRDREWEADDDPLTIIAEALAATNDPQRAVAFLERNAGDNPNYPVAAEKIALQWAKRDPEAALVWVRRLDKPSERADLQDAIIESLIKEDPQGSAARMMALPAERSRAKHTITLAVAWAEKDVEGALAWSKANLDGFEKIAALSAVGQRLMKSDPEAAIALIDEIGWHLPLRNPIHGYRTETPGLGGGSGTVYDDHDLKPLIEDALKYLAKTDPRSAIERAEKLNDEHWASFAREAIEPAVSSWFQSDPREAQNWIREQPVETGSEPDPIVRAMLSAWAENDPETAAEYARELPQDFRRKHLVSTAVETIGENDVGAALDWLGSVSADYTNAAVNSNGGLTTSSISNMLSRPLKNHPAGVAAELHRIPAGKQRDQLTVSAVRNWASSDPAKAAQWLGSNASEAPVEAYEKLAEQWATQDVYSASVWIGDLPASEARDGAISTLIEVLAPEHGNESALDPKADYDSAFNWALAAHSAATREDLAKKVLRHWATSDPIAAREAIESSSLSPSEQTAWIQSLDSPE